MHYRRPPTKVQWVMIVGALISLIGFIVLGIPEVAGIISPELEDTFSEWAWDLPLGGVIVLSGLSLLVGAVLIWFSIHIWEGWVERRRKENNS